MTQRGKENGMHLKHYSFIYLWIQHNQHFLSALLCQALGSDPVSLPSRRPQSTRETDKKTTWMLGDKIVLHICASFFWKRQDHTCDWSIFFFFRVFSSYVLECSWIVRYACPFLSSSLSSSNTEEIYPNKISGLLFTCKRWDPGYFWNQIL